MIFQEMQTNASIMLVYLFKHIHEHYNLPCSLNVKDDAKMFSKVKRLYHPPLGEV